MSIAPIRNFSPTTIYTTIDWKRWSKAKIKGEEVATPPAADRGPPVIIDFMAALKASLDEKRPRSPGSKKLAAGSGARSKTAAKRRKSG